MAGTMYNVRKVAMVMPPTTGIPMAIRPLAPSPMTKQSGRMPRMVERAVIRIGRKRWAEASTMASDLLRPLSLRWLANSTIRIPFLATRPISMISAISLKMFMVTPNTHMKKRAPNNASGTVNMMMSGSLKLSNWAASTRKIRIRARPKAKNRLDELSWNSFDSPARAVRKVSSSTSAAMRSISSRPWPMVYPFWRPDDTVAEIKRL